MKLKRLISILIIATCGLFVSLGKAPVSAEESSSFSPPASSLVFEIASMPFDNDLLVQHVVSPNIYAFNYRVYTPDWCVVNVEFFQDRFQLSPSTIPSQDIDRCIDQYEILYPFHEFS